MKLKILTFTLLLLACCGSGWAQADTTVLDTTLVDSVEAIAPPAPVFGLTGEDKPNDHGHAIILKWDLSPDDGAGQESVLQYEVFRWIPFLNDTLNDLRSKYNTARGELNLGIGQASEVKVRIRELRAQFTEAMDRLVEAHGDYPDGGYFTELGVVPSGKTEYEHSGSKEQLSRDYVPDRADLYYRVDAVTAIEEIRTPSEVVGPVHSFGQWFNKGRKVVLVAVLFFTFATILFVVRARRGAELYVRPIGGIEAVDDAIGRATEMGRPILYVLGLGSAADVATIASFTILGRVAKRVAEYQTELIVPTYDPIVMSVAQEVVKSSFLDAGRPEAYNEDIVHFVTQSQFAYVAAVNGTMLRELPATNVYMGKFYAESLLLAETGAEAGSIQIAGTDEIAQIPFFIVACDYTLIGEELYAASAYLGREPVLLGSLKAQDLAKAGILLIAILGMVAANLDYTWFTDIFKVVE
jgi:hypothetical protein